jgi:hypothetical protein
MHGEIVIPIYVEIKSAGRAYRPPAEPITAAAVTRVGGMNGGGPGTGVGQHSSACERFFRAGERIMTTTEALAELVDELYAGRERIDRDEIYRRAVAAELPSDDMAVLDRLPEGEYAEDELNEAIAQIAKPGASPLSVDEEPTD